MNFVRGKVGDSRAEAPILFVLILCLVVAAAWVWAPEDVAGRYPAVFLMQLNTALCLALLALSIAASTRSPMLSRLLLAFPIVVSALSEIQSFTETSFDIERLIFALHVPVHGVQPTPMALNSATAILALSLSLLLARQKTENARLIAGGLTLLSLTAAVGGAVGYALTSGAIGPWAEIPQMAPHTAFCLAILCAVRLKEIHYSIDSLELARKWHFSVIYCLGFGVSLVLWWSASWTEHHRLHERLVNATKLRSQLLNDQIAADLEQLRSVSRFFASSENVTEEEFRRFCLPIIESFTALTSIGWAGADRILRHSISRENDDGLEPVMRLFGENERAAIWASPHAKTPTALMTPMSPPPPGGAQFLFSVSSAQGYVLGVLSLDRLANIVLAKFPSEGPALEIAQADGRILFRTHEREEVGAKELLSGSLLPPLDAHDTLFVGGRRFLINSRSTQSFALVSRTPAPGILFWLSNLFTVISASYLSAVHRKRDELRDSNARLEAAVERAKHAASEVESYRAALEQHTIVAVTDRTGKIIDANSLFCSISGYSREELLGNTHAIVNSGFHPRSFFVELWKTIGAGEIWRGEICNRTKDGRPYWVATTIVPVVDERGIPERYIALRSDITALKSYELALCESRDAAEAAARAKSLFLARMSHEIRTPVTAIVGFAMQLLDRDLSDAERNAAAQIIQRNANHLHSIVNDVLDFSKIEAGQLTTFCEPTDLYELVSYVRSVFDAKAKEKDLSFSVRLDSRVPRFIRTDPVRLKQILLNILSNAMKFTESGGVRFEIDLSANGSSLSFSIADTGIGIAPEQRERLFNEFSQLENSTTKRFGGTGLGLAISKRLSRLLGGDISVESSEGGGTTFTVTLPCEAISEVEIESSSHILRAPSVAGPPSAPALSGSILVAEDGQDNQLLLGYLLRKCGLQVRFVENGEHAVRAALDSRFDLVLMDMQMPVMDGYQATANLRAAGYRVPIIACTGDASKDNLRYLQLIGCNDVIFKPFSSDSFYDALSRLLPKRSVETSFAAAAPDSELRAVQAEFVRLLPSRMGDIRAAEERNELSGIAATAHKLASASMFGFPELSDLAVKIEQAARSNELSTTTALLGSLYLLGGRICEDFETLGTQE